MSDKPWDITVLFKWFVKNYLQIWLIIITVMLFVIMLMLSDAHDCFHKRLETIERHTTYLLEK